MTVFQELDVIVRASLEKFAVPSSDVEISYPVYDNDAQDGILRLEPRDNRCLTMEFLASGDLVAVLVGIVGRAELDWSRQGDHAWLGDLLHAVIGGRAEEHVWDPEGISPSGYMMVDGKRRLVSNHIFPLRPADLVHGAVPYRANDRGFTLS